MKLSNLGNLLLVLFCGVILFFSCRKPSWNLPLKPEIISTNATVIDSSTVILSVKNNSSIPVERGVAYMDQNQIDENSVVFDLNKISNDSLSAYVSNLPLGKYYYLIELENDVGKTRSEIDSIIPSGIVFCASGPTAIVDVINPSTGKTWMDRNLGASQAANSSTDANSYGDLYQWGRGADDHQCRTSPSTTTLSTTDQPGHGDFITSNSGNYDWRSPKSDNLWQGVNGVNNPCPSGYRLPTYAELNAEVLSWTGGAFSSPLKLPRAGYRRSGDGSLGNVHISGFYWSSTVNFANAVNLSFYGNSSTSFSAANRTFGFSVRCIRN